MKYEYKLNSNKSKKYGFDYLICDGWFGIYKDNFNKKLKISIENGFTYYDEIKVNLTDKQIEDITRNSICKEY